MTTPNQNQYQNLVNGTSPAGRTGGQQAGYTRPYQPGQRIQSYADFNQTAPSEWAGGPPNGQLPVQQPRTDQAGGSGGAGASR